VVTRKPGTTTLIEDVAFHIEELLNNGRSAANAFKSMAYRMPVNTGMRWKGIITSLSTSRSNTARQVAHKKAHDEIKKHWYGYTATGSLKPNTATGRNKLPIVSIKGEKAFAFDERDQDFV
jgi:hypothetical protein